MPRLTPVWAAMTRYGFSFLMASVCFSAITESNAHSQQTKKAESAAKHLKPGDKSYPTDKAPKAMRSMIQDGAINLVFSTEPDFVKRDTGNAHFFLRLTHKFGYGFSKSKKNDLWQVKLAGKQVEPSVRIEHVVRLPAKYKGDTVWKGRLVRHEFDHVYVDAVLDLLNSPEYQQAELRFLPGDPTERETATGRSESVKCRKIFANGHGSGLVAVRSENQLELEGVRGQHPSP